MVGVIDKEESIAVGLTRTFQGGGAARADPAGLFKCLHVIELIDNPLDGTKSHKLHLAPRSTISSLFRLFAAKAPETN